MTVHSTVETRGYIDRSVVKEASENTIRIEGWAASLGAGAVEGFNVMVAGMPCEVIRQILWIPSPDVQAVFPQLDHVDQCRFVLCARLPDTLQRPLRDVCVRATASVGQT
jgi:hypothetical protein